MQVKKTVRTYIGMKVHQPEEALKKFGEAVDREVKKLLDQSAAIAEMAVKTSARAEGTKIAQAFKRGVTVEVEPGVFSVVAGTYEALDAATAFDPNRKGWSHGHWFNQEFGRDWPEGEGAWQENPNALPLLELPEDILSRTKAGALGITNGGVTPGRYLRLANKLATNWLTQHAPSVLEIAKKEAGFQ